MKDDTQIKEHPASLLFPPITNGEFDGLKEDIAEHGLRDPIVLFEGAVLDGRNRLRACQEIGIEPSFTTFNGPDPYAYVISTNMHRRNLTASQRAAIAAEAREPLMEEGRRRMAEGGRVSPKGPTLPNPSIQAEALRSREIVGKMFDVGHMQVGRAVAIKKADPELFEKVKAGEVTVGAAHRHLGQEGRLVIGSARKAKKRPPRYYGKGDKWEGATTPLLRYLASWAKRDYKFTLVNQKEAEARVKTIDELIEHLQAARADLEPRSHAARLRVRSEKEGR